MHWDRYHENILWLQFKFMSTFVMMTNLLNASLQEIFVHHRAEPLLYQHILWLLLNFKSTLVMMISLLYDVFQEGFVYHHAEPDYIMLTYWIPESPSTLPPNASHQVGVGAIVINDKNEVYIHTSLLCAEDCLFFCK